jgi:hypothetical protein
MQRGEPATGEAEERGVIVEAFAPGVMPFVEWASEAPGVAPAESERVDRAWRELRAANDAMYDGPIVRVLSADAETGALRCARSTFRHVATAAKLGRDVRQLGTERGGDAHEHVLLARRSGETRVYPGLWENAPSGGVSVGTDAQQLYRALADEADEELGLELPEWASGRGTFVGWLRDPIAMSLDLIVRVHVGEIDPHRSPCFGGADGGGRWEYTDAAWLARADALSYFKRHADAISPPTAALAKHMGWV